MSKARGRRRWVWPIAAAVVVLALQLFWVDPGPMTIDEVTYQRMTHDLVHRGDFFIDNGYEQLPSAELTSLFIVPTAEGKLAAQYPYGSAVLGAPLYALFGPRGMFLLNGLAFVLALVLCHRVAYQLLRDHWIASGSVALLASTYFTEYGFASWPHASSVACMLAAFSLGLTGHQVVALAPRRALKLYVASGFIVGVGMALRLDTVLCAPAIAAPLFFASPTRVKALLAFGAAMLPGVAFVALTNYARWGALSPMSYGPTSHSPTTHVPFLIAAVVLTAMLWIVSRPPALAWARGRVPVLLGAALCVLVAIIVVRRHVERDILAIATSLHGVISYVADLRLRPNAVAVLDQGTAVVYAGAFKKALLQSAPFLVLVAVPIARAIRVRDQRMTAVWLLAIPFVVIAFFGVLVWHGGLGINLRYALGALPFLCILSAWALRDIIDRAPRWWWIAAAAPVVPACVLFLINHDWTYGAAEDAQAFWILTFPLVLATLLLLAVIAWTIRRSAGASVIVLVLTGAAVGWSLGATIDDMRWAKDLRSINYEISECVADRIADDSLLISEFPNAVYGVVDRRPGVTIALPIADTFATTHDLIRASHRQGRRVFAVLGPTMWKLMRWHGALDGYRVDPMDRISKYVLGEIRNAAPGARSEGVMTDITGWHGSCGRPYAIWQHEFDPRFGPAIVRTRKP